MTRVMVVDDHSVVRCGVRAVVDGLPGWSVVSEAGCGEDALDRIAEQPVDLVVMDVIMTGLDGIEATAEILRRAPATRVLVLTSRSNGDRIDRALQSGARGFCGKSCSTDAFATALQSVARGELHVNPGDGRAPSQGAALRYGKRLSPRQLQILTLIAMSYSTKQIAQRLAIALKTVESHRTALMRSLGAHNIADLVRFSVHNELISLSSPHG